MSNLLYRSGRWIAAHPRRVVVLWMLALGVIVGTDRVAGGAPVDDFQVPGVESQAAIDLLEARFPERAGATAMVVFHAAQGSVTDLAAAGAIGASIDEVRALDHVLAVTDPLAGPRSPQCSSTGPLRISGGPRWTLCSRRPPRPSEEVCRSSSVASSRPC